MKLRRSSVALLLPLVMVLFLAGCHRQDSAANTAQARAEQRAEMDTEREQLDMIPPPAKSRYMAIHSFDSWENPYLVVQSGMLELHVTMADANTTSLGAGGMFRPVAARRQELNISLDRLGEAMSAIPHSAWPYGRVIAIEEARKIPASVEPNVRRHMEVAIATLNNLGIVVYDLNEGNIR